MCIVLFLFISFKRDNKQTLILIKRPEFFIYDISCFKNRIWHRLSGSSVDTLNFCIHALLLTAHIDDDDQSEDIDNEAHVNLPGPLQLHLVVTNDVLQSDHQLKTELGNLFGVIISKSNGNAVFPSNKTIDDRTGERGKRFVFLHQSNFLNA